jgi:hypothetical protein
VQVTGILLLVVEVLVFWGNRCGFCVCLAREAEVLKDDYVGWM